MGKRAASLKERSEFSLTSLSRGSGDASAFIPFPRCPITTSLSALFSHPSPAPVGHRSTFKCDDGGLRRLVERGNVRDVNGLERHGDPMGIWELRALGAEIEWRRGCGRRNGDGI
ncbi:hypothetical protein GW17_00006262 [Ensete ventricosum]|nr:hypothetical protein GW17_00006262 [Ensete ventricosum]